MARGNPLIERLGRRLACHQALHDHRREPRNTLRWLPLLRSWQTQRLEFSFEHFLDDPQRRAAAHFFLTDVYGDRDFSKRDANVAKVLPMMQRLLPASVLGTVADGIELGALTHALDLRMAAELQRIAPLAKDAAFRSEFAAVKAANKARLAAMDAVTRTLDALGVLNGGASWAACPL